MSAAEGGDRRSGEPGPARRPGRPAAAATRASRDGRQAEGVLGDRRQAHQGRQRHQERRRFLARQPSRWRGQPDELIELALRHYPYGQVGSGRSPAATPSGGSAAAREAEEIREKARKTARRGLVHELLTARRASRATASPTALLSSRKDPPSPAGSLRRASRGRHVPRHAVAAGRRLARVDRTPTTCGWPSGASCAEVPLRPATCADAVAAVADDNREPPGPELPRRPGLGRRAAARHWLARLPRRRPPETRAYVREVGRKWLISAVARIYAAGLQGRPRPHPGGAAGRRQVVGPRGAGAGPGVVRRRDQRPRQQGQRPGPARQVDHRAGGAERHEARRDRAHQGVHVAARRPLPAELRPAVAGLPAPVRVRRHHQRATPTSPTRPATGASGRVKVGHDRSRRAARDRDQLWAEAVPPTGPARRGGSNPSRRPRPRSRASAGSSTRGRIRCSASRRCRPLP